MVKLIVISAFSEPMLFTSIDKAEAYLELDPSRPNDYQCYTFEGEIAEIICPEKQSWWRKTEGHGWCGIKLTGEFKPAELRVLLMKYFIFELPSPNEKY